MEKADYVNTDLKKCKNYQKIVDYPLKIQDFCSKSNCLTTLGRKENCQIVRFFFFFGNFFLDYVPKD